MSTKIYSAITEPTQSHPERALYKQTYVNTMMTLLPALMKVAPQVSATVARETLVLGPGFTFAIDIDGFGRAITFEQHGSSWRVAAVRNRLRDRIPAILITPSMCSRALSA